MADGPIKTLINAIKADWETNLPALLLAASLNDMDTYQVDYPDDSEDKVCATYFSDSDSDENQRLLEIITQFQLTGELDITGYLDIIDTYIQTKTAHEFDNYNMLRITMNAVYPGDIGSGGSGGFIFITYYFRKNKTRCN